MPDAWHPVAADRGTATAHRKRVQSSGACCTRDLFVRGRWAGTLAAQRGQVDSNAMSIPAYLLFVPGAFICILNFHTSFIRPAVHRMRGQGEYRFVSGFPLIGSLMLVGSFFLLPAGHILRPVALVIALFDTGGIHWFCVLMVHDFFRRRRQLDG